MVVFLGNRLGCFWDASAMVFSREDPYDSTANMGYYDLREIPLMNKPRYYIYTWDQNKDVYTPQAGVRCGPYSLFGLRKPIRKLQAIGYVAKRGDSAVIIEKHTPGQEDP